jgi:diaminopimelate epimerase
MNMFFKKYHCLGRDFILLDNRDGAFGALQSAEISRLCARRFGVGASGILRLDKCSKTLIEVKSYNFNGAFAELNVMDAACVAVFAKDLDLPEISTNIEINEQIVSCTLVSNHENMHFVNVRMLDPVVIKKAFQNFVMDCGAQFCMIPTDDVSSVDVVKKGREISYNKRFPKGANVTFYQPHPGFLEIRHYEHQADQETYTNGLCVIGAALSHAQNNRIDNCLVRAKGGEVQVSFARSEEAFYNVELHVLVNAVYCGTIN